MEIIMQQNGHKFYKPGTKDVIEVTEETDPALAERMFRMDTYCVYYIAEELGINGFNLSTSLNYLSILNRGCSKVIEACCDLKFPIREAIKIIKLNPQTQKKLLNLLLANDMTQYQTEVANNGVHGATTKKKEKKNTAPKALAKLFVKSIEKGFLKELEANEKSLYGTEHELNDELINITKSYIESIKSLYM